MHRATDQPLTEKSACVADRNVPLGEGHPCRPSRQRNVAPRADQDRDGRSRDQLACAGLKVACTEAWSAELNDGGPLGGAQPRAHGRDHRHGSRLNYARGRETPSVGELALAWTRFGMRPAMYALRPASTPPLIASAMSAGSRAKATAELTRTASA